MLDDIGARATSNRMPTSSFIHTGRDVSPKCRQVFQRCQGIMVGRPFPPLTDWVRISMAKPDEMRYIAQVYRENFA